MYIWYGVHTCTCVFFHYESFMEFNWFQSLRWWNPIKCTFVVSEHKGVWQIGNAVRKIHKRWQMGHDIMKYDCFDQWNSVSCEHRNFFIFAWGKHNVKSFSCNLKQEVLLNKHASPNQQKYSYNILYILYSNFWTTTQILWPTYTLKKNATLYQRDICMSRFLKDVAS